MRNRILLFLSMFFLVTNADAQTADSATSLQKAPKPTYRKNLVKMNVTALLLNNYSFSYERLLTRKISFTAGYRIMPKTTIGEISLLNKVYEKIDEDYVDGSKEFVGVDLNQLEVKSSAITAEFRFYTGKKPGARGFYFSLYGKYADFKSNYNLDFESSNGNVMIPMSADNKAFAGGFSFGVQWQIAKRVAIDLTILGAHYGTLKGDIVSTKDLSGLSPADKQDLQDQLDEMLDFGDRTYITSSVSNQGITGTMKGPFAGLKTGISIGIAF
ncbi:MAG: DUF3575 domain-containing protein [Chitinophagaceae bacterium]|nr:DUF3575 domain-containing protein [Chitinophagaceae bacterium]